MKKTSKLLLLLTTGIVITLVIVSAGCLSMFSAPSSSSNTSDSASNTNASLIKGDSIIGTWKPLEDYSDCYFEISITDESTADFDMTAKIANNPSSESSRTTLQVEKGDKIHYDCKIVEDSSGSYSISAQNGILTRDGEDILEADVNNYNLGTLKYDKANDKVTYTADENIIILIRIK